MNKHLELMIQALPTEVIEKIIEPYKMEQLLNVLFNELYDNKVEYELKQVDLSDDEIMIRYYSRPDMFFENNLTDNVFHTIEETLLEIYMYSIEGKLWDNGWNDK